MTTLCPSASAISELLLNSYLDKNISEICPHGYTDNSLNHCAHFVCHVTSLSLGATTCRGMGTAKAKDRVGVCIRVHELFRECPEVGLFNGASEAQKSTGFFVMVTAPNVVNLKTKTMTNVPKKHVGIFFNGTIWHYSNTKDKVVTATPDEFRRHYRSQVNELFFGTFPANAMIAPWGCGL